MMVQLRLYIAELLLGWAFSIMPNGKEKDQLAEMLVVYAKARSLELRQRKSRS